jgi:hypothetical protein
MKNKLGIALIKTQKKFEESLPKIEESWREDISSKNQLK